MLAVIYVMPARAMSFGLTQVSGMQIAVISDTSNGPVPSMLALYVGSDAARARRPPLRQQSSFGVGATVLGSTGL